MMRLPNRQNHARWFPLGAIAWAMYAAVCSTAWGQLENTSLARVPADVDFYVGGYRMAEPWRQFWESDALRALRDSAVANELVDAFQQAWRERRGSMARMRSIMDNRNTKEALRFLEDVFSRDVCFVADASLSEFMHRFATVLRKSHLLADPSVSQTEKAELVYGWIDQLGPNWNVPNLILAGSITDKNRALSKVDEVEGLPRFGLGMRPEAKPVLQLLARVDDDRGSRLRWRLPFASIPWDSIPTNEIFDRESLDRLREVVADKSLVLTFGILDDRFIVGLGNTLDLIPAVPVESSLLHHPHLQSVRDHQQANITGIRYTSDRLARAIFELGLKESFAKLANAILKPQIHELDDSEYREWLTTCVDDAGWIDSTIEAYVPEPRGSTEFSMLVENGWEIHAHNRTVNAVFRGKTPLEGARRWGTRPLLVLDVQLDEHPEYFEAARSIVRRVKRRLDELRLIPSRELPDPRWIRGLDVVDRAWPIVIRAADLWQNHVLPNMSGEHVFVLHAGALASHQWHPSMPRSKTPLPMPEAALLTGIRESKGWLQTLRGVRDLLNELLAVAAQRDQGDVSLLESILHPERLEQDGVITFGYPIPETCPAPKAMMPRVRIEPTWSILSYSDSQVLDLSHPVDPGIGGGRFSTPLQAAKAAWIDLGGLAAMASPWIEYAIDQSGVKLDGSAPISIFSTDFNIRLQAEDMLHAWRTLERFGHMSSVTTIGEDGSTYCRSVFSFGD